MRWPFRSRRLAAAAAFLALAALLPAAGQVPRANPAPDVQCRAMEPYVADANRAMPRAVDATTEDVEIRLDCVSGTITYVKRLLVAPATLPEDWVRFRQAQHTASFCSPDGASIRYGLVGIDEYRGPDGAPFATLTTTPADCAAVEAGTPLLTPAELDAYLARRVEEIGPTLPAGIDEVTTLMAVFHGAAALVYFYQLGFSVPEAQRPTFEATAGDMRAQLCADPGVRLVLFSGGTVTYRYSDNANAPVFSVAVTAADCAAAP
ncbi:MAG: hypothetical protein IT534_12955 [Bauldia sp.]|nr:hypothetical protein [Bauldia sp.]